MSFKIYSKPGCPFCVKVKDVLRLSNQNFVEYSFGKDFNKEEFYSKFGNNATFPQVLYEEQKLGGCSDTIKFLKEQNLINV